MPKWAKTVGLKPKARDGILCFNTKRRADELPCGIFVHVTLRVPLIQRMHVGTQAGHIGYERTLAKLRQQYIWGNMAADVQKASKMCIHVGDTIKKLLKMCP